MEHEDIARAMGISHQAVSQLEAKGLRKMRRARCWGLDCWEEWRQGDAWTKSPAFVDGCRQVGALRWR